LTAAFDAVGHRVAVCGFRSYGRTDVRIILAKAFSELATESVYRRIAALHPAGFTRLGAVVRHGTSKLLHESAETHRLLLVVSDGVAFDHEYERPYGRADTRRALAEARAAGIAPLFLTVGGRRTHTEGAFTSAEHLQVAIPEHIDPVFCRVVRRALLDVSTSRSGRVA
jgi:nitric oxide reductase activation protein